MWIALLIRQRGNRRPSVCRRSATNVAVGINDREDPAIGASATETTTYPVNGARAFDHSPHDGPPGDDRQSLWSAEALDALRPELRRCARIDCGSATPGRWRSR